MKTRYILFLLLLAGCQVQAQKMDTIRYYGPILDAQLPPPDTIRFGYGVKAVTDTGPVVIDTARLLADGWQLPNKPFFVWEWYHYPVDTSWLQDDKRWLIEYQLPGRYYPVGLEIENGRIKSVKKNP